MANADSPSNLIWLLNNTEAGATTPGGSASAPEMPKNGMAICRWKKVAVPPLPKLP